MGKIKGRDKIKEYIKKYGSRGVDFFSLKDDGDSAKVRMLHTDDQDLDLHLVHRVEVDGRERWIECLEEDCPFCQEYGNPTLKLFILLHDYSDEKVKCWERGVSMVDFLLGFIDKYGPLNNRDYEIVRHGKKGSTKTSYQLFPMDKGPLTDDKGKEIDIPEKPEVYGRFVLQMTKEEMLNHMEENKPIERNRNKGAQGPGF